MKKSDLQKLVGRNLNNQWEVASADYDTTNKAVLLTLKEFEWYEKSGGKSIKNYSGNIKEVKILDKYAFTYYNDGDFFEAVGIAVKSDQGLHFFTLQNLSRLISNPAIYPTTMIQNSWIRFLKEIGEFNKDEYVKLLYAEYRKHLIKYHSEKQDLSTLKKYTDFFAYINEGLEQENKVD